MPLDSYTRHASDPPPAYLVRVLDVESQYLSAYVWFVVEWTTDPLLFDSQNMFGRTADNFYPLDTAQHLQVTRTRDHIISLPSAIWKRILANHENRHLHLRIGYGSTPDFNSWNWKQLAHWQINHDPVANAGPAVHIQLIGGAVESDVVLDASRSYDPDPGTQLSYEWRLIRIPSGCLLSGGTTADSIHRALQAGSETVTILPAGTAVPDACRGLYQVELVVTDDDPPSFYGTIGRDSTKLDIIVGASCASGICIDAPTVEEAEVIEQPGMDLIRIRWSVSPEILSTWSATPGARLRLAILAPDAATDDPPVYLDWVFRHSASGSFLWSGFSRQGAPVETGFYDIEIALLDAQNQPITHSQPTSAVAARAIAVSQIGFWADLVSHRPPHVVQIRAKEPLVAGKFHAIEKAFYNSTNLDYFPVRITQLPTIQGTQATAEQLLEHFRLNLNSFVNTNFSEFLPYGSSLSEAQRWQGDPSNPPQPLGALIGIDLSIFHPLINLDDGSVICSAYAPNHWRFSTLFTLFDSYHPVSGNREWGIRTNSDGSHTFYTQAADRATTFVDVPFIVYSIGTLLWKSLQDKTSDFINQNGGMAHVQEPTVLRPKWTLLKNLHHHPTVSWLPNRTF